MSASDDHLSFEVELIELENKIEDLKEAGRKSSVDINKELISLQRKHKATLRNAYKNLTPWQIVEISRHHNRPHAKDYLEHMFTDFIPLSGDRLYGEDKALIGGVAKFNKQSVVVLGIEKGSTLEDRIYHNFGMPNPWGYRKAIRLMDLAEKLRLPVIALVDTSGAYPGLEAEERGQGSAIATSIARCLSLTVPMISVIIGEGGSGGALAIAAGDSTLMLEYSIYSVISPEGCASILWKDEKMAKDASKHLCITAQQLKEFNIVEKVIHEPLGGAHRHKLSTIEHVKAAVADTLTCLNRLTPEERLAKKQEKFLNVGLLQAAS